MVVLNTTVLIDVLRGHSPAVDFLERLDGVPLCSEITRLEVMRGLRTDERGSAERLMSTLVWRPVDELISRRAGELGRTWRYSHTPATTDLVISTTSDLSGLPPATSNVCHFPMFEGLHPPYRD